MAVKNVLILTFFFLNTIASATNYYISSSGNDTNNGLSSSTPWKTIAKVNASYFMPGDTIFFKKGDTLRETLMVPSSGNSGAHITFAAYGIGNKPIITLKKSITGWDTGGNWTELTTTTEDKKWIKDGEDVINSVNWRIPIGVSPNIFTIDGNRIRIKFDAHSTGNIGVTGAYIAEQAVKGDAWDMKVGTITQITFNSGSNATTLLAGVDQYSDWIDFTFDHTKEYIISIGNTGFYSTEEVGTGTTYFKVNASNTGKADIDGCSTLSYVVALTSVEVKNEVIEDVWYKDQATNVSRLWVSGREFSEAGSIGSLGDIELWHYDSSNELLYVHSTSNPATNFTNIEFCGSNFTIYGESVNYITIMDLDVRGSSSSSMNIYGCDNWIVQDCDIGKDAGKFGLSGAGNPTHTSCDNIIIRRCNFDSGDRIIHSYAAVGVEDGINIRAGCHNWDIYNNVFLDWSHSAFYIVNLSATYTSSGNKFHRNEISAPDIDYGRPLGVDGLEDKAMDNEVYNNYIHDCGVRIQLNANGTKFHNNIINGMSNAATPYRVDGSAQGIALEGYSNCFPHDMEIYNNVIANCDEAGLLITCDGLDIQHNLIKNNIFFNCGKDSKNSYDGYQIVITDNAGNLDNTFQNNLLFKSGVTDLIYYGHNTSNDYPHTIEEFNAENGTASDVISGNIAGNPLFIAGSPYNYRLGVGSPAINTGLNVGLTTDYDGNTMKDPPSIGAYEHYLSVLPVNHPPVVTISNPRKGNKYENSATITIDAVASDPDGTISKVEFYCGSIKLSELTLAPYTYTWKDVSAGTYAITAVATDNLNASTTSSPVELVVESNIKYDANSEIIKLYPNPSDGHFSIKFVNPLQNEKNAIVITDLAGKQIYNDFVLKEETIKQIDISYIKSGIYILMIIYKEIFVTKKIIID